MSSQTKTKKQNTNEFNVELYKELDEITLATILQKSDMIRFIDSNHAYAWNKETLLWTPINSKQQINTMVCEILSPILEKRTELLWKEYAQRDKDGKDRLFNVIKSNKSIGSATKVKNIICMAGRSVVNEDFFNQKTLTKNLLPIRNGYCLDIVSLEKRKRKKTDYFTFETDTDLSEKTKDAEDFLKQYCPDKDNDTYTYLTEILGYCLTPWNFMKSFFVFYGESGENGKSVLLNIMEKLMGSNLYTSVDKKMFTQIKNNGGATPELCQCVGKYLGTFGETTNDLLDETIIKMITGDDTITIRPLYQESKSVRLYMKLLLSGNERPSWKHTQAMQRRVMFFEFANQFVEKPTMSHHRKKDEKIVHKFLTKKSYRDQLFTVLITSASRLFKSRKFTKSEHMEKQKGQYVNEIDTSDKFLRMLVPKPKAGITCGNLFEDYIEWCKNENLKCETKGIFSKKLCKMFKPRDKKLNGNTVYDVAIPADCDNVFVDSDNDGLKRKLFSADNENQRLTKQLCEYETQIKDQAQQIKDQAKKTKKQSQLIKEQSQQIKDLQKLVFNLQANKASKETKSERVQERTVNAMTDAINKHFQQDDGSDEENSQSDDDSNDDSEVQDSDDDEHSFTIDV